MWQVNHVTIFFPSRVTLLFTYYLTDIRPNVLQNLILKKKKDYSYKTSLSEIGKEMKQFSSTFLL